MVGALMYLTACRPDFVQAHVLCSVIKAKPTGGNISLRLSGSFHTLKIPLTWVSAGLPKSKTALQYLKQKPSMCLYLRAALKFYGEKLHAHRSMLSL
ncbi:hypothetical protein Tco_0398248 [Tanacetum coccineum]